MKCRQGSIDLLRIMSMLGIVGLHILNNGGVIESLNYYSTTAITIFIIRALCYTSVDLFAMITGYLHADKETINYKRIIELWGIVFFYSIIITIVLGAKSECFSDCTSIIRSIFPPIEGRYWYITCYTLVFLLIPYLNKTVAVLSENEFRRMLLLLFIALCCVTVLGLYDYFRIEYGYSSLWLIYCYLIGAYIRKNSNRYMKLNNTILICVLSTFIIISSFSNIIYRTTTLEIRHFLRRNDWLVGYNSPLTVISAIIIMLVFSRVQKDSYSKILKTISNATFGIYILHSHPIIYDYYIKNAFSNIALETPIRATISFIIACIGIFTCCCLIEIMRHYLALGCKHGVHFLMKIIRLS